MFTVEINDKYKINISFEHIKKGYWSTRCYMKSDIANIEVIGVANCFSKDNFSRKIGRKLSLKRALEEWENCSPMRDAVIREMVWNKYWELHKK